MRTYYLDFGHPEAISALEKLVLRSLLLSAFQGGRQFLPAQNEKKQSISYRLLGSGSQPYSLTLSHAIIKSEKKFHYHVLNGAPLGAGVYGETISGNLDLYLDPNQGLEFIPLGQAEQYAFKFLRNDSLGDISTEVALNNAYRPGEKGQSTTLITPKPGENATALVVMPLRPGKNLEQCDIESMGFDERIHLVSALMSEFRIKESQSIIHRDLKESNIVYEGKLPDGKWGAVRIVDWGLATTIEAKNTHHAMGAEGYRPPEAVTRRPNIVIASDKYSLGPILAKIFGAKNPCLHRDHFSRQKKWSEMASAPLDLSGIFEGFALPPYFENDKELWKKILMETGNKNPELRPRIEDFENLLKSLERKKYEFPDILKRLQDLFDSVQFLLQCDFLRSSSPLKKPYAPENLVSLEHFFPCLLDTQSTNSSSSRIHLNFFPQLTFEALANKIADETLSSFSLLTTAMTECSINTESLNALSTLLKKRVDLVKKLEYSWKIIFEKKLGFYLQAHNLSEDFQAFLTLTGEAKPLFARLDAMMVEARKLQNSKNTSSSDTRSILISHLITLGSRLGQDSFLEALEKLEQLIQHQDQPKPKPRSLAQYFKK